MGHSHKRKYPSDQRHRDVNSYGVGRTVADLKRRRLSEDGDSPPSRHDNRNNLASHHRSRDTGSRSPDGWQVAESKSSKRARQREESHEGYNNSKLIIANNVSQALQIKDLQNLVLYCLADGVAPTWLAVQNAKGIKKVVVLMVPGLDVETMDDSEKLMEMRETSDTIEASGGDSVEASSQSSSLSWLFDHVMEVRTPGNSQQNTIYSPLQAMLISPVEKEQEASSKHNRKPNDSSKQTPVTDFILSAEVLRDAEYPIHPAAFTNKIDAQLEYDRRMKTGQSIAAGWVDTNVTVSTPNISTNLRTDSITRGATVYALDCEMVLTTDDVSSLARISVVDWNGKVILDKYVQPDLPVKNYFTQFSGITPEILSGVKTTLKDIQRELLNLLTPSSVILGHSLESDLNAMKLTHPFIIDTSILYPHPRGLPLRSSLKYLANKYLKREIQKQSANGHDSVEDARAVLDLIKLKCERGRKFGTTEANGESIFRRIARSTTTNVSQELSTSEDQQATRPRTSAIIEYGTPEKGLGKDATYAIGCSNDAEITAGIIRAVHGDDDNNENGESGQSINQMRIPSGGADFIWSRFRELDVVRDWNTLPPDFSASPTTTNNNTIKPSAIPTTEAPDTTNQPQTQNHDHKQNQIQTLQKSLLGYLSQIHTSLPEGTLLVIYSGTNDMRPVLKLQARQAQFRREFKVKKWDELTVKWTDVEEQMLKREVNKARKGWGVVCVK